MLTNLEAVGMAGSTSAMKNCCHSLLIHSSATLDEDSHQDFLFYNKGPTIMVVFRETKSAEQMAEEIVLSSNV
jgi:hypothetical protein